MVKFSSEHLSAVFCKIFDSIKMSAQNKYPSFGILDIPDLDDIDPQNETFINEVNYDDHEEDFFQRAMAEEQQYLNDSNMLKDFVASKRNVNTVKKTKQTFSRLVNWLKEFRNEERDIAQIPPQQLNIYIGGFLMLLKKADGSDYEPDSLTSFHRGIDRYLRESDYPHSIMTSEIFSTSRQVTRILKVDS